MDVQLPGFGVAGITEPPTLGLEGALKSPFTKSTEWPTAEDPTPTFHQDLEKQVNLPEDLQSPDVETPDPVITAPLYGRWHAMVRRLQIGASGWVHEMNADPRTRVAAGLGTRVVQKNQERYMEAAWKQVGDVLLANQRLRQAQLARASIERVFAKDIQSLPIEEALSLTTPVHKRVLGSPQTIHQQTLQSRLPAAALSGAFRKITRPRGAIAKRAGRGARRPSHLLRRLNDGRLAAARPKRTPPGLISYEALAESLVPSWLPDWARRRLAHAQWILWLLLALVLLAGRWSGAVFPALAAALVIAVALYPIHRLRARVDGAAALAPANRTAAAVEAIPPRPAFRITEPGGLGAQTGSIGAVGGDSQQAASFRAALIDLHGALDLDIAKPLPKPAMDLEKAHAKIMEALDPRVAIPKRILTLIDAGKFKAVQPIDVIHPVMAHPDLPQPMYEPLRDISSELLVPNLNLIPLNTIGLLETNQRFIESYLVGLNHEMARELLWREYPTDQRGSYFRQFWDVSDYVDAGSPEEGGEEEETPEEKATKLAEKLRDIKPIHTWGASTSLGDHNNRDAEGDETQLVLVIRGDLLKRYPNTVIFARPAKWQTDEDNQVDKLLPRLLDYSKPPKYPLYGAEVEPDIHFLGFDLTPEKALGVEPEGPGWYFVLQERPGEARFGLDAADAAATAPAEEWNDLSWGHLVDSDEALQSLDLIDLDAPIQAAVPGDIDWNTNAADMAFILYQVPVMIAVHAHEMLPPVAPEGP